MNLFFNKSFRLYSGITIAAIANVAVLKYMIEDNNRLKLKLNADNQMPNI